MAYLGNSPGVSSQRVATTFTATAGQTAFNPVGGYTLGYADVYLNGVKLIDGTDFTAADGVTITLASGAALNDNLETLCYTPHGLSDGYTKPEADARYQATANGSINVTGTVTASGEITANGGIDVTGTATMDGLTVDGSTTGSVAILVENTLASGDADSDINLKTASSGGELRISFDHPSATSPSFIQGNDQLIFAPNGTVAMSLENNGAAIFSGDVTVNSHLEVNTGGVGETASFGGDDASGARALQIIASTTTGLGDTHTLNATSVTGVLQFATQGVTGATLDASRNLLVGKTTNDGTTAGHRFTASGFASHVVANDYPLLLNRLSSDGALLTLRKDSVTVGTIGVTNGNNLTVGGAVASHAGIQFGTENVTPMVAGVEADGGADLGATNLRWRDLYLSGGVYLGGTGAANKLDDYEEGTWTPAFAGTTGTFSGTYTKVGRLVYIRGYVNVTGGTPSAGNGTLEITGLPFNPSDGTTGDIMTSYLDIGSTTYQVTPYALPGSKVRLYASVDNNGWVAMAANSASSPTTLIFTISYEIA